MNIHEYQAKELFQAYGIPVPAQKLARSPEEARLAALELGCPCVVKAQVHAGGRGKAGGVKLVSSPADAAQAAGRLLGTRLVTHQSGPAGNPVDKVLVTACSEIAKEYYLALTVDAALACPVIIASADGGTEIETLAREHPERICRIPVAPETGLLGYHSLETARRLGMSAAQEKQLRPILSGLYRLFWEKDCSLVEINPLTSDAKGVLTALDAKIHFDDNALFRHPELAALRDPAQEHPAEVRAREAGFSYIALDGDIGCLVNGAGLAMATMDMIRSCGGRPANFLDVGGSASADKVTAAFSLLLSDPNVRAILVNIFGGIMQCDVIAEGVAEAARRTGLTIPLVVRLQGTHLDEGRRVLRDSGIAVIPAESFSEAVEKAVAAAKGGNRA